MKAYVEVTFFVGKDRKEYSNIIPFKSDCITDYIYKLRNDILNKHGYLTEGKKTVEFIGENKKEQKELEQRAKIFQKMLTIGLPYMNMYQSDITFYDKITIFTTNKIKYLWCLNPQHTYILNLDAISDNVKEYNQYIINYETGNNSKTRFFIIDIKKRTITEVTKEEAKELVLV